MGTQYQLLSQDGTINSRICQITCPLFGITSCMPKYEEVLELYFHCKLCCEPQAYIEADLFVKHVEQNHGSYIQPEKQSHVILLSCPPNDIEQNSSDGADNREHDDDDKERIHVYIEETPSEITSVAIEHKASTEVDEATRSDDEHGAISNYEYTHGDVLSTDAEDTTPFKDEPSSSQFPSGNNSIDDGNSKEIKQQEKQMDVCHGNAKEEIGDAMEILAANEDEARNNTSLLKEEINNYVNMITHNEQRHIGEPSVIAEQTESAIELKPEEHGTELVYIEEQMKVETEGEQFTSQLTDETIECDQLNTGKVEHPEIHESNQSNVTFLLPGEEKQEGPYEIEIEWAGSNINELSPEEQKQFLETVASKIMTKGGVGALSSREVDGKHVLIVEQPQVHSSTPDAGETIRSASHQVTAVTNHPLVNNPELALISATQLGAELAENPLTKFLFEQSTPFEHVKYPGTSECWHCHRWYKPHHVASCVRAHRPGSEKPACDTYICVADKSQPIYPCRYCLRIYLDEALLISHLQNEHIAPGAEGLNCDLCSRPFNTPHRLALHLAKCRGPDRFRCPICSKEFPNKQNFTRHLSLHGGESTKKYVCEFCGKAFHTKNGMIIHTRNHTGEKPFKCEMCDASFKTQSHLIRHRYTHTQDKKYVCKHCGKGYVDKSGLDRHVQFQHTEGGTTENQHFPCPQCHKVLRSKRQRDQHVLSFHSGASLEELCKFQCDICQQRFRSKRNMEIHRMRHTGERPFSCTYCSKAFYKKPDLDIHIRVHTGEKPYKCEVCGRAFGNAPNLLKHRLIHTGERRYHCEECNKTFVDPSHLARHKKVHTGEKPFQCTACERCFATKQQVQNHALIHANMLPYVCGGCGLAFRQKDKALRHRCTATVPQQAGATVETDEHSASEWQLVIEPDQTRVFDGAEVPRSGALRISSQAAQSQEKSLSTKMVTVQVLDESGRMVASGDTYDLIDGADPVVL